LIFFFFSRSLKERQAGFLPTSLSKPETTEAENGQNDFQRTHKGATNEKTKHERLKFFNVIFAKKNVVAEQRAAGVGGGRSDKLGRTLELVVESKRTICQCVAIGDPHRRQLATGSVRHGGEPGGRSRNSGQSAICRFWLHGSDRTGELDHRRHCCYASLVVARAICAILFALE
jgi:hypothetical protein